MVLGGGGSGGKKSSSPVAASPSSAAGGGGARNDPWPMPSTSSSASGGLTTANRRGRSSSLGQNQGSPFAFEGDNIQVRAGEGESSTTSFTTAANSSHSGAVVDLSHPLSPTTTANNNHNGEFFGAGSNARSNLSVRSPNLSRRTSQMASFQFGGVQNGGSPPPGLLNGTPQPPSSSVFGTSGVGFASARLGLRRWISNRLRGLSARMKVVLLVVCGALLLWSVFGRGSGRPAKMEQLTVRWWDSDATGKLPSLLPRPSMIPKPPKPNPSPSSSHSLSQLSRMKSSFNPATPPDWTAVIHLSSTSQLPLLSTLIPSILKQSLPPHRTLILAPDGLKPDLKPYGPSVSLVPFPTSQAAGLAIVLLASGHAASDYLLVVDGNLNFLQPSYVKTLLRASGTKAYSSALLSGGGVVLPISTSPSTRSSTCLVTDGSSEGLDRTTPIHAPTTPFLLQTTWLTSLSNGLRTDVPMEVGLSLALWTKASIPSFGIPVPVFGEGQNGKKKDFGCERLRRSLVGREASLGSLFKREKGAGSGLPTETGGGTSGENEVRDGAIVMFLSGDEELALAHPVACGFAQDHLVRVYVSDSETAAQGPQVFFPETDGELHGSRGGTRCHLDVHPLGTGAGGDSIQMLVVEELERIGKVEVVMFVIDGDRGREFAEVMKWSEGVFGVRTGGKRRTRKRVDEEGGMVVIPLEKTDMAHAEWLTALPIEALRHWHTPKIDINVITNDRPASLYRLLEALQDSHYFGDEISLSINLEQTADRLTQRIVDEFPWPFGAVTLRHRIILGGLMPAIVESWYPASNDSYGVFLEDDVEVSPFFYAWLKFTILYYRYYPPMRERSTRLFGISLYQQKMIELRLEGRRPFDAHELFESLSLAPTLPYLSQIPCSWGAAYFPEVWREFHSYLALRLSEVALPISDPIVPEIKSNKWPRSWKRYFIELVYMRGYVMLYPNYADFTSFSTNHMEKGTHIHVIEVDAKRKDQFEVPLMARNGTLLDLPEGRLPDWDAMPVIDLWGAIASDDDIAERGWQTVAQIDTCPPFRLDVPPTYNARELLCPKSYIRQNVLVDAQPLAVLPKQVQDNLLQDSSNRERPPIVDHPDQPDVDTDEVAKRLEREQRAQEARRRLAAIRAGRGKPQEEEERAEDSEPPDSGSEQLRDDEDEEDEEEDDLQLIRGDVDDDEEPAEAEGEEQVVRDVPIGQEAYEIEEARRARRRR